MKFFWTGFTGLTAKIVSCRIPGWKLIYSIPRTTKDTKKIKLQGGKIKLFSIIISEGNIIMNKGTARQNIKPGASVGIVLKQDQRSGKITRGIVKRILTNSSNHPHGIKVELEDGRVGRVKEIHS